MAVSMVSPGFKPRPGFKPLLTFKRPPGFKPPPIDIKKSKVARLIKAELKEMQSNPSNDFKCLALEDNPYDWQFAIRGLNGTEFEGGIYHGQMQFPVEYPNQHPIFTLLTENGLFKTHTGINLNHNFGEPFTVRRALLELIDLLHTHPNGALGSVLEVEHNKEVRRALAIKSRAAAPKYGTTERQKLIDEIHEYMLSKESPLPSNRGGDIRVSSQTDRDSRKWAGFPVVTTIIQQELEEMQSNPSDDFKCLALTGNPYDWQFAIKGPNGTDFEGGIYHGRIQFPVEYPNQHPIFTLLTENGRFKTQTEINLNHNFGEPFTVRSTLLKLIELLPTYPNGALVSVEYDKKERHALAVKSREAAPRYGTAERQKLIDKIHEYMLSKVPHVPSNGGGDIRVSSQNDRDRRQQDIVTQKRKRKQGNFFFFWNTINADNCKRAGFFDFGKKLKSLW
ncbi:uncharacterized protein LOC110772415 [Prunus avium]|uniref:Uncharacterized protein LOC110772415 n=1 Tax=Prunus avium TaxID=42229 RepID=A0A6P5TZD1_PRUAV|nr:uncharacterized protein LOC110772415 [Prunus avium]XP_021832538.1 uncharacterized protein LOC110772415 [Prunus avium]